MGTESGRLILFFPCQSDEKTEDKTEHEPEHDGIGIQRVRFEVLYNFAHDSLLVVSIG
jgi:hypothetical protein